MTAHILEHRPSADGTADVLGYVLVLTVPTTLRRTDPEAGSMVPGRDSALLRSGAEREVRRETGQMTLAACRAAVVADLAAEQAKLDAQAGPAAGDVWDGRDWTRAGATIDTRAEERESRRAARKERQAALARWEAALSDQAATEEERARATQKIARITAELTDLPEEA